MSQKIFRAYYVWPKFPSLSMSGDTCGLHCKHCNHVYLNDMRHVPHPENLYKQALAIHEQGAVGCLISGGCTPTGEMLNLRALLPTIQRIKKETDLIIKLHTGLVDQRLAEDIVRAGVDIASLEVVGSQQTINDIFGFSATPHDYTQSLQNLTDAGMLHIVPHVCIGLHYGKIQGELHALDIIKTHCHPSVIVFIIFRPTKGTPLESTTPPDPTAITQVITYAKTHFPTIDLSLGCIRPRNILRTQFEKTAVEAGVTRMEIPTKTTLALAHRLGYTIKKIDACCALPEVFEERALHTEILHTHRNTQ
ncbi:MAG: radical SAM protein [Candidatus Thermoplasmatota archaeon]|nr:radical SAM protein [Candidatus Thermoplasmatota archaeon]MBU1941942.1 radical SAM protein [Candidatus Thermoplasmatota archaeon]